MFSDFCAYQDPLQGDLRRAVAPSPIKIFRRIDRDWTVRIMFQARLMEIEFMCKIIEYYIEEYTELARGVLGVVCRFCSKNGPGVGPAARVEHVFADETIHNKRTPKICPHFLFTSTTGSCSFHRCYIGRKNNILIPVEF